MEKSISAANANRKFTELLKGVRKGRSYVVTSHGEPVAKVVPAEMESRAAKNARVSLFERLQSQAAVKGAKARRRWTRDELYEDEK